MAPQTQMNKTIRLAANVVSERFDDEAIIINLIAGNYYSLRGVSFYVWSALEAGKSIEEVRNSLIQTYPQTEQEVIKSFEAFIKRLVDENLIREDEAASKVPNLQLTLPETFEALTMEVFTDMQDLLLLDPIHEVEEEKGWPFRKEN